MWTGKMFVLPSFLSKNSQGRIKQFYPFLLHPYWQHLENQKSNHFGGYIPNPRKAARDISVTRTVYKNIGIKGGIQEVWWTNSIHVDAVRCPPWQFEASVYGVDTQNAVCYVLNFYESEVTLRKEMQIWIATTKPSAISPEMETDVGDLPTTVVLINCYILNTNHCITTEESRRRQKPRLWWRTQQERENERKAENSFVVKKWRMKWNENMENREDSHHLVGKILSGID